MQCKLFILPRSWPSLVYIHRRYYSKKQLFTRCKPVLGSTKLHTSAQKLKLQPYFIPNSISTRSRQHKMSRFTKWHFSNTQITYHTLTDWDEEGVTTSHLHSHKTNVDSQIKETTTQNQYDNMLCVFLGEQTHRCDYKEFYNITAKWDKQLTTLKSYITETD